MTLKRKLGTVILPSLLTVRGSASRVSAQTTTTESEAGTPGLFAANV